MFDLVDAPAFVDHLCNRVPDGIDVLRDALYHIQHGLVVHAETGQPVGIVDQPVLILDCSRYHVIERQITHHPRLDLNFLNVVLEQDFVACLQLFFRKQLVALE